MSKSDILNVVIKALPTDTIGQVITVLQAIILLATLIFMYFQFHRTISVMSAQLTALQKQVSITSHEDLYDKLLCMYYKYIEYADDLKGIFRSHDKMSSTDFRQCYMIFAILDIVYLMYLQRDTLDIGLRKTWEMWADKIFQEPKIFEVYEQVKSEYDSEYVKYLEEKHKIRM
jgi:hypothetical protein